MVSRSAAAAVSVALMVTLVCGQAAAQGDTQSREDTIFFGMNLGLGVAQVKQPGLSSKASLGLEYDAAFGLGLTRHWAAGIELATWQPFNLDGNPSHLHFFAWRLEYTFGPLDGLVATTSLGLALGDGSQSKRIGSGGVLQLGWRWAVARHVTMAIETGVRGAAFTDGTALDPFVALQLRFYGRSGL